jgi:hypothetical protein
MRMLVRQDEAVDRERPLPFQGRVLWLTLGREGEGLVLLPPRPGRVTRNSVRSAGDGRLVARLVRRMVLLSPFQAAGIGTLR